MDVFTKAVVVLDCPDATFLCHADVEDFHDHEQVASETGEFGADDEVVLLDFGEQSAEGAFVVVLGAADCLFYPTVDREVLRLAEPIDLEALVLDSLLVAAHANVAVGHVVSNVFVILSDQDMIYCLHIRRRR